MEVEEGVDLVDGHTGRVASRQPTFGDGTGRHRRPLSHGHEADRAPDEEPAGLDGGPGGQAVGPHGGDERAGGLDVRLPAAEHQARLGGAEQAPTQLVAPAFGVGRPGFALLGGSGDVAEQVQGHGVEQRLLVPDPAVDGHGGHPEAIRHGPHADGVESLFPEDLDRRGHDLVGPEVQLLGSGHLTTPRSTHRHGPHSGTPTAERVSPRCRTPDAERGGPLCRPPPPRLH